MSRRNGHRRDRGRVRDGSDPRPDTPGEIQAASLTSPYFRESWSNGEPMTWQQFIDRWECRFRASPPPE